jgi:surface protein
MKKLLFILLSIQLAFASSPQQLTSGETINQTVKKTEKQFYKITVPKNKSIHVNLTELEADIDLYIKKGNEVRLRFNDCYSSNSNTQDEECILTNEGETSEYSILVYGYQESSYTLKTTINGAENIPTLTDSAIQDDVAHKKSKHYKLTGEKGRSITVTLSDLTADADLRVKVGQKASLHSFDCKSTNGGTKTDECTITPKKDGTVYIQVYGYKAASYSIKASQATNNPCLTIDELKKRIKDNEDVTHVNTSCITNMDYLFANNSDFNQDISSWDVSHVTSMNHMFAFAELFNQDLRSWDTENVVNMNNMFYNARNFVMNLKDWNVDKVSARKYFYSSPDNPNDLEPKWKDLDTVLIDRAKAQCQNIHDESNGVICSDVDNNIVYIVINENDIGNSGWIFSKAYAINTKSGQESVTKIYSNGTKNGPTRLIKLANTNLVAIDRSGLHHNNQYISFYNPSGTKVIDRYFDTNWERVKEIKTINNGSKLIIQYDKEEENPDYDKRVEYNDPKNNNVSRYIIKRYKDTYQISDTSNVTLISHIEL